MVFSQMPNLQCESDWKWLLHELVHVEQYLSSGDEILEDIDGFAIRYLEHSGSMEEDAVLQAGLRLAELKKRWFFSC